MIAAIGTDILEIGRLERVIAENGDAFLKKVFTESELQNAAKKGKAAVSYYAGRWCSKEAVSKMLGTGIGKDCSWLDITVKNDENGAPSVELSGNARKRAEALGITRVLISISHERHYCTATVIGCRD